MSLCALTEQCVLVDLPRLPQVASAGQADAFEVHLTVPPLSPERLTQFRETCRVLRVKTIVIHLGDGIPQQPMTCSRIQGTLTDAHAEATRVQTGLQAAGFAVIRSKIEAAPWNAHLPPDGYYEHHARLHLHDPATQEPGLRELCRRLGVHLSRNPFKVQGDGSQQRFVTLRHEFTTPAEAHHRAAHLWTGLRDAGLTIQKTITEYCVYDDHRALDAPWEQQEQGHPLAWPSLDK